MPTNKVHFPPISTNTKPKMTEPFCDPTLPPQRHAGAVGIGPNYPLGPSLGTKIGGAMEEIKGKIMGKSEVAEHGRERRTGESTRNEWKAQDDTTDPSKVSQKSQNERE